MKLRLWPILAVAAYCAALAAPAHADVAYKTGPEINTAQANCFPLRVWASYSQQKNGGVATEPRVDDVFYVSVYYSFFQTFDCAADFVSAQVTLPPGVAPVNTASPICRRWGGQSPNFIGDYPRISNACPTSVSFDPATRKFGIRPKAGSPSPDFPDSGFWFIGQRAPQENVNFHSLEFLVPVRATSTVSNQPIGLLACSVGTSCASGGVNLSVNPAPAPSDPPRITFAGQAQTTAVGARIPFSVNSPDTNPEFGLKLDTSTNSSFSGGRPCGQTGPQILPEDETQVYVGDHDNVEFLYGDLDNIASTPCALAPSTTYHLKACTIYFTGATTYTEQHCQTTSFTTGAVSTRFTPPQQNTVDLAANTNILLRQHQVVGGRPSGNLSLRYRLKGSGSGYTLGPNQNLAAAFTGSTPVDRTIGGLTPWRSYEVVSCYQSPASTGPVVCGDPTEVSTGFATAPADAADIGPTSVTLAGQASAPSPAGDMRFLVGTTDPGDGDVRGVLTERKSTPLAARSALGAPVTATVDALAPETTYYWAACFDNPAGAGVEDCSPARSFTTASAPPPPPADPGAGGTGGDTSGGSGATTQPDTTQPGGSTAGGPVGGTADTLKPKASVKLKGRVRRGQKVTLTVTPSDPSGIKSVTIKVGKAKAKTARKVTIKLPRTKATIKVLITVTDGAGNVAKLTKTLKVK